MPQVRASQEPILIARQPIVDTRRAVVAYELFDRSVSNGAHNAISDVALVFNAMSHAGSELPVGTMDLFINCSHQSLACLHLELVRADKVVLEVGPVPAHGGEDIAALRDRLADLRRRGFRLAFDHTVLATVYKAWQPLADYVKLNLATIKLEQLADIVAAIKARTGARVVAEKIESAEQFAALSALGVTLFQGYWLANPDVIKAHVVAPAHASVLQLFNLARNKASTDEIEVILKKDAVLGFNLMRLINSAGFGLSREVDSFRHAIMLMGLDKLFRWAALLLAASHGNNTTAVVPTTVVVGTTAVVRGRMMELLAKGTMTPDQCDSAFVVGVFSLLDELLNMSMAHALDLLTLPPDIDEALRSGGGVYGPLLALTKACEATDDDAFGAAATTLGFSNHHINMAHMDALVWADSIGI